MIVVSLATRDSALPSEPTPRRYFRDGNAPQETRRIRSYDSTRRLQAEPLQTAHWPLAAADAASDASDVYSTRVFMHGALYLLAPFSVGAPRALKSTLTRNGM